ncbi:MAG: hypothetical protein HYY67_06805 [Thaumarchaeota archaeon]|nr:hypothetical protein [Nitrososphaerota archaeon]
MAIIIDAEPEKLLALAERLGKKASRLANTIQQVMLVEDSDILTEDVLHKAIAIEEGEISPADLLESKGVGIIATWDIEKLSFRRKETRGLGYFDEVLEHHGLESGKEYIQASEKKYVLISINMQEKASGFGIPKYFGRGVDKSPVIPLALTR